jgi:hypothetical protein
MGQQFQAYLAWSRNLQQQAIEQRWLSDQAKQRGMRDILGGTVRLKDPTTGESFEASGQDRYYFRVKGADRPSAIGTDTDAKPVNNLDLTRLLKIGTEVVEQRSHDQSTLSSLEQRAPPTNTDQPVHSLKGTS